MDEAVGLAFEVIAGVAARLRGRDRRLLERSIHVLADALSSTGQQVDDAVDSVDGQLLDTPLSSLSLSESSSAVTDSEERADSDAREGGRRTGQQVDSVGGQRKLDSTGGQHAKNAVLAGCWDGVGGVSTGGSQRARIGEIRPLLERLARERNTDPVKLFQAACDRFKRDESLKAKRMSTLPVLLSQLEQWVDDAPPMPSASGAAPAANNPARKLLNPAPTKAAS